MCHGQLSCELAAVMGESLALSVDVGDVSIAEIRDDRITECSYKASSPIRVSVDVSFEVVSVRPIRYPPGQDGPLAPAFPVAIFPLRPRPNFLGQRPISVKKRRPSVQ